MKVLITDKIMDPSAENKFFYISGYANPKLRSKAICNVKPTEVIFVKNDTETPYRVGVYDKDREFKKLVARNNKSQIVSASRYVYVFDNYHDALTHYNAEVMVVANMYNKCYEKTMENLL